MIRSFVMSALAWTCCGQAVADTAVAPTPRQLIEIVDITGIAMSPDGRHVAYRTERAAIERNAYLTTWFVQGLHAGALPTAVGDGGAPARDIGGNSTEERPVWSPDGRWIYFKALVEGTVQVWRAASDGSGSQQVTSDPSDVREFGLALDGQHVRYLVGATRDEIEQAELAEYYAGIRIDGTVPIGQGLFRSGLLNDRPITQRFTDQWMMRVGLLADAPTRWRIIDVTSREARDERPSDARRFNAPPRRALPEGADPVSARWSVQGAAFVSGEPRARTLQVRLHGQRVRACAREPCASAAVDALAWRPGSTEIVFTRRSFDRGISQDLWAWNYSTGATRRIVSADGLMTGDPLGRHSHCAVASNHAACVFAGPDQPPRLERIDLESGARLVLFNPNAELAEADGASPEIIEWEDAQGRRFAGVLFLPDLAADLPAPLFITYYACPGYLRGGLGEEWPLRTFASAGIAALCINMPPSQPGTIDAVDDYVVAQGAIEAVVRVLDGRGVIDSRRVGMGGLSFGSEVVLWMSAHTEVLAAGSVTSNGVSPAYYWFNALRPSFRDGLRQAWALGAPEETPERWAELSPVHQVDRIRAALLMQMPEQEYLAAVEYFSRLAVMGRPVELYAYPHAPHIKFQPRQRLSANERNLDWFRFWLQGHVDPAPEKAEQYRRWTAMRDAQPTR